MKKSHLIFCIAAGLVIGNLVFSGIGYAIFRIYIYEVTHKSQATLDDEYWTKHNKRMQELQQP